MPQGPAWLRLTAAAAAATTAAAITATTATATATTATTAANAAADRLCVGRRGDGPADVQ
ncbi:MAG TPA: hypothetical protein VFG43_08465 [Geminicoccaceae bacterium]|nr:hypothetical protein [Geminicoccaceae bacterium]